MQFHVSLFPYDRWQDVEEIGRAARHAEELGFDGVSLPDHVVMPVKADAPPVSTLWYDPFVLGAHLATLTRRLRLIFNVLVVPYRPALPLAKMISTLDVVAQGRLTVGVGAGWLRGEFRSLGLPFEQRGAILDETLAAMKVLWTEPTPAFEGRTISFRDIAFEPKCVQQPHVPIWIGGGGRRAIERVVAHGDGWSPMVGELGDLARDVASIRELAVERGRDPDGLEFAFGLSFGPPDAERERAVRHAAGPSVASPAPDSPDAVVDAVGRRREAGFGHLMLAFAWDDPADFRRRLDWFASRVMTQPGVR